MSVQMLIDHPAIVWSRVRPHGLCCSSRLTMMLFVHPLTPCSDPALRVLTITTDDGCLLSCQYTVY